ncbi:MAG: TRAP transporter small permease subunit [Hyphomicrobiaceae bacterium]
MAGSASILTDDSQLSRLDIHLYRIEKFLALVSGIAVFFLMLLAVVSVGGRNLFNHPLQGYVDWIEQVMPLIAFMGIAYTQRDGGHIRMDILVGRLKGRALYVIEFITTLAVLILMVLLVWGSWAHFDRSFDFSAPMWSRDSSMDIALPIWPTKLLVPIAFSVLCLRLCLQIWAFAHAIVTGIKHPIAVPRIEDAATLAAKEAKHVSGRDT